MKWSQVTFAAVMFTGCVAVWAAAAVLAAVTLCNDVVELPAAAAALASMALTSLASVAVAACIIQIVLLTKLIPHSLPLGPILVVH